MESQKDIGKIDRYICERCVNRVDFDDKSLGKVSINAVRKEDICKLLDLMVKWEFPRVWRGIQRDAMLMPPKVLAEERFGAGAGIMLAVMQIGEMENPSRKRKRQ